MAASELERLLIKLEVDTLQMRQALKEAETGITRYESTVDKSFGRAANRINAAGAQMSSSFKAAGASILSFIGISQLLAQAEYGASLERTARQAGMTVEAFETLGAVARQAGLDQKSYASAMEQFTQKAGEARLRSGEFYGFLKDHLPTVARQIEGARTQEDVLSILADAIRGLGDEQSKTLLATKAFGDAGRDMVEVLRGGSDVMKAARDDAARLSGIIGDQLAADAAKAGKEFTKLKDAMGMGWSAVLANISAGLLPLIEGFNELIGLGEKFQASTGKMVAKGPTEVTVGPGSLSLKPKEEPWVRNWQTSVDFTGVDRMRDLERQRLAAVRDTVGLINAEYERELEEFRRLKAEGKIDEEDFQKARVSLNQIAGVQIAEHMEQERERLKTELSEITYAIEDALTAPLRDAFAGNIQPMQTYFKSLLSNLAQATTQMLVIKPLMDSLTSSIGGSSFMTGLLGIGKRASGGPVSAGRPYLVGERGPELMVPNSAGRIVPNHALGGGGGTVINQIVDARGADISVAERVQMALAEAERRRPKPVADVAAYRKRFPTRGA